MKPIIRVPNPVLSSPARAVTVFGRDLARLIAEMKVTLGATSKPKGVGLAAPQVGESARIFLTRPNAKGPIRVFINPEIISIADPVNQPDISDSKLEGCLSIPEIWGAVKRAPTLTLRFQDEDGATHEEEFSGFLATIIQHESDHLNGILFTQRVLEQHAKLYKSALDDKGKEVLDEITI